MDAMAAVAAAGVARETLREALAAALVKDERDRAAFDRLCEAAFPPGSAADPPGRRRRRQATGGAGAGGGTRGESTGGGRGRERHDEPEADAPGSRTSAPQAQRSAGRGEARAIEA